MRLNSYVIILAAALLFVGCAEHKDNKSNDKGPDYEPFDHFYFQRSYPEAKLDLEAFDAISRKIQREYSGEEFRSSTSGNWQSEGPTNIGGRLNCIAVHPSNQNIILTGSSTGGIYKTTDGGITWYPVGENMAFLSMGDITFDPTDNGVVYAGTGDPNISGIPHIGDGIYKSLDGGETWEHKGLTEARIISRIVIDPDNTDIIYTSTMGLPFEPGPDRGLYKSTDGGETWSQILFVSEGAGIIDLVIHPSAPSVIYAAGWDRIRNNTESIVTGTNGKIWKSTDGGDNWNMLTQGLPQDTVSRIGLAISGTDPDKVYALYVGTNFNILDIFRSTDGGDTWGSLPWDTDEMGNALGGFGWYFGQIRVSPWDDNEITILGVDMYTTFDGGLNWASSTPPWWSYEVHADKHDLVYLNASTTLLATDGGLYKGTNFMQDWEDIDEIPNTQFYRIAINPHNPGYYTGGTQDNGTTTGNLAVASDWNRDYGGDGFQPLFDPVNESIRYAETQNGGLVFNDGFQWQSFTSGINNADRRNWDMPIIMSHFDNTSLFTGTYRVYRIGDAPYSEWNAISPDLTDGVIYGDRYHTITTIAQSHFDNAVIYAGTTDANVWVTTNGGSNWINITDGLPERYVTNIKSSPETPGTVFVSHNGYKDNDFEAHIHMSTDYGSTWQPISGDLDNLPVNHLEIFDDVNLLAATDFGVYVTTNGGVNWERVGENMPLIPVFDIEMDVAENRLVAGTFSRSIMTYPLDSLFQMEPTEVEELGLSVFLYPNPVNEILQVSGVTKGNYEIYDVNGTLVKSGVLTQTPEINVATLSAGYFSLIIRTEGSVSSHPFIKNQFR